MPSVDTRTGIEVIGRDECLELLAADEVGRLGVVTAGSPRILPVNYALDGDTIVFRTGSGIKLEDGIRSPACFEVDAFDRRARSGWSVLAVGHLEEVLPVHRAWARVQELHVDPWAAGQRDHFMRLVPSQITGRRV